MARKKLTYAYLMEMARAYGVQDNAMFVSACSRYLDQVETISAIQKSIDDDGLMIEHTNVKGDVNSDVNPLVVQLPKYLDTANRTLALMLDIIERIGKICEEDHDDFNCD